MRLDPELDLPILALVTRLTEQKGVDLVLSLMVELLEQPLQKLLFGKW